MVNISTKPPLLPPNTPQHFQKFPTEISLHILKELTPQDWFNFGLSCKHNYRSMLSIPSGVHYANWNELQCATHTLTALPDTASINKTRFYKGGILLWGGRAGSRQYSANMRIVDSYGQNSITVQDHHFYRQESRRYEGAIPLKTGGMLVQVNHGNGGCHFHLLKKTGDFPELGSYYNCADLKYDHVIFKDGTVFFISEHEKLKGISLFKEGMKEPLFMKVTNSNGKYKNAEVKRILPLDDKRFAMLVEDNYGEKNDYTLQIMNRKGKRLFKHLLPEDTRSIASLPDGKIAVTSHNEEPDITYKSWHPEKGLAGKVSIHLSKAHPYRKPETIRFSHVVNDKAMVVMFDRPEQASSKINSDRTLMGLCGVRSS